MVCFRIVGRFSRSFIFDWWDGTRSAERPKKIMTIKGMKKTRPGINKTANDANVTAALANGAARILPHVKLPMWMEMELAQALLTEGPRSPHTERD